MPQQCHLLITHKWAALSSKSSEAQGALQWVGRTPKDEKTMKSVTSLSHGTFWPRSISQQNPSCLRLASRFGRYWTRSRASPEVDEQEPHPSIYRAESPRAVKPSQPSLSETNTCWQVFRGPCPWSLWRWAPCHSGWHGPDRWGAAPAARHVWQGRWHHDWAGSGRLQEVVCEGDRSQLPSREVNPDLWPGEALIRSTHNQRSEQNFFFPLATIFLHLILSFSWLFTNNRIYQDILLWSDICIIMYKSQNKIIFS